MFYLCYHGRIQQKNNIDVYYNKFQNLKKKRRGHVCRIPVFKGYKYIRMM